MVIPPHLDQRTEMETEISALKPQAAGRLETESNERAWNILFTVNRFTANVLAATEETVIEALRRVN